MTGDASGDWHRAVVPTRRPFTADLVRVARLVVRGWDYAVIAAELGLQPRTIRGAVARAADLLPGDLPPRERLIVWARGASLAVLTGPDAIGDAVPVLVSREPVLDAAATSSASLREASVRAILARGAADARRRAFTRGETELGD